ncbi:hypothetical protein HPB52_005145 [Rhipicephalus sanguineus]|uniref:Uncharacterized protein n=1 Tax=Rhipicephalus sanguineus TaxID=34632 RepID=A0A9D4PUE8_RHISA|nr:hypothetical protein HPB52_005145 [Rhipicephalus sanguineus]
MEGGADPIATQSVGEDEIVVDSAWVAASLKADGYEVIVDADSLVLQPRLRLKRALVVSLANQHRLRLNRAMLEKFKGSGVGHLVLNEG